MIWESILVSLRSRYSNMTTMPLNCLTIRVLSDKSTKEPHLCLPNNVVNPQHFNLNTPEERQKKELEPQET